MAEDAATDKTEEEVVPPEPAPIARLRNLLGDDLLSATCFRDEWTVTVPPSRVIEVLTCLRDDTEPWYDYLVDITAVDYLNMPAVIKAYDGARFMVVYHLYSHNHAADPALRRLRVKTPASEQNPVVPSADRLWASADWAEREVWDLFGIRFEGHPDLRRILMPDDFESHPLRKDYPVQGRGERSSFDFETSPSKSVSHVDESSS